MVEKTIHEIKETEAKADAIVKDAEIKSREILDHAAKEAAAIKAELAQTAKQKAESDMARAKEEGTQSMNKVLSEIELEVKNLKASALAKEEDAVNLVISQII